VFASDGHDVDAFTTDILVIHQGETFDIALTTSPELAGQNFFVRVRTTEYYSVAETGINHQGWALLRYAGAPEVDPEPVAAPYNCLGWCRVHSFAAAVVGGDGAHHTSASIAVPSTLSRPLRASLPR
jgi:hypothetical protein